MVFKAICQYIMVRIDPHDRWNIPFVAVQSPLSNTWVSHLIRQASQHRNSGPIFQTMWPPRWGVWSNETSWFFRRVKDLTS